MTIKRVNYKGISDQCLIDSFKRSKNEQALAELYERYRVSLGNYLKRRMKSSQCVTKTFNSVMTQLLVETGKSTMQSSVAISLFALAYRQHSNFSSHTKLVRSKRGLEALGGNSSRVTEFQLDVIELVFKLNFTPAEAAEIIDAKPHEVHHCLRSVAWHNQNIKSTLKRYGTACQTNHIVHPSAVNQDNLRHMAP